MSREYKPDDVVGKLTWLCVNREWCGNDCECEATEFTFSDLDQEVQNLVREAIEEREINEALLVRVRELETALEAADFLAAAAVNGTSESRAQASIKYRKAREETR